MKYYIDTSAFATHSTRDVRSLDAIHLAVAESQLADAFITYDVAQALAALSLGMALKTK
ncbi:hypothetical protein FACS1894199_10590 [Bacteroidia bacterium]|nr:hypothetical protein FACS1894199_10590 [Bacteroidia bacterium]